MSWNSPETIDSPICRWLSAHSQKGSSSQTSDGDVSDCRTLGCSKRYRHEPVPELHVNAGLIFPVLDYFRKFITDCDTSIIGRLNVRPSFIIARGGITSSDVETKALRGRKATVMGQIKSGIPV